MLLPTCSRSVVYSTDTEPSKNVYPESMTDDTLQSVCKTYVYFPAKSGVNSRCFHTECLPRSHDKKMGYAELGKGIDQSKQRCNEGTFLESFSLSTEKQWLRKQTSIPIHSIPKSSQSVLHCGWWTWPLFCAKLSFCEFRLKHCLHTSQWHMIGNVSTRDRKKQRTNSDEHRLQLLQKALINTLRKEKLQQKVKFQLFETLY